MILPEGYRTIWSFYPRSTKALVPKDLPLGFVDENDFDIPIVINSVWKNGSLTSPERSTIKSGWNAVVDIHP